MRPQELNMLVVFDAIMTEGSITRAAESLSMTQPAVSNTVARMRVIWKDELFIRDGRNIKPTLFATNLWTNIQKPLRELSESVDPVIFDPLTSTRTFHVGAADVFIELAWADLRKLVEHEAPGINLYAHPYTISNGTKMLDDSEVDIAIGGLGMIPQSTLNTEFLYRSKYICIMRKGHHLCGQPISLDAFTNADHLLVSLSGDPQGFTDHELAKRGLKRRVAMTVNHFSAVVPILLETNLIAVVPSHAVIQGLKEGTISMCKPPIDIDPISISAFWHKRKEGDQGLIWLRNKIHSIIGNRTKEHKVLMSEQFKD